MLAHKKSLEEEEIPDGWNEAVICSICKKSGNAICANCKGIALLDVTYKVLVRVIRTKPNKHINGEVGGFRRDRSASEFWC